MLLTDVFDIKCINLNLESMTKEEAFKELIETIALVHPEMDRETLLEAINARESKMTTSVIPGAAIPHGCYPGAGKIIGAIGISHNGIEYDSPDHKPVYLIFMLLMGEESREKHLHILNKVFSIINSEALKLIQSANSSQEVYEILGHFH
jgi:mannitol/fructose-specific phosphotransferase system IIA component (Ntr-type)